MKTTARVLLGIVMAFVITGVAGGLHYRSLHNKHLKMAPNGVAMEPTLQPGEVLDEQKPAANVQRGDIVVFNPPNNAAPGVMVLRVIAVGGERVVISQGKLTVYNSAEPNGFNPDGNYEAPGTATSGNADVVVPSGDVYVLGDNRANALDSRDFGPILTSSIVGKIINY